MSTEFDTTLTVEMLQRVREMFPFIDPAKAAVVVMNHDEYGRVRRLIREDYDIGDPFVSIPVRVRSWATRIYLLPEDEADFADVHFLQGGAAAADDYAKAQVAIHDAEDETL